MALARIGLGANLGDCTATIERALGLLLELGIVVARSQLYRTKPWGPVKQPDFINAAALLETQLAPRMLLSGLKALERRCGRLDGPRWGPRAIDLDLLAYDDVVLKTPELTLPHPGLGERAFALIPLAEIDPVFSAAAALLSDEQRSTVTLLPDERGRQP